MLSPLQKKTAQAIVNVFETGRPLGDYGQVTLLAGDSGQLTYGRSQTTLASGNLHLLIKSYCAAPDAALADALASYLPALDAQDVALNHDMSFRALLHAAGSDPVMQACQDGFFDRVYWTPAQTYASTLGVDLPLSVCVVYDSVIHGSWRAMRDRTLATRPDAAADQKAWIAAYVATRRTWLANHSNKLLRKCVYRMDALQALIEQDAWDLALPLSVRGVQLTQALLDGSERPLRVSAQGEERLLKLREPMMTGEDVKALQAALGFQDPDGKFGPDTAKAVTAFQKSRNLTADGIAGPATMAALRL